jgi:hypothetical protein
LHILKHPFAQRCHGSLLPGRGKMLTLSRRVIMVLPGRNTAAIIWLKETEMRE